MYVCSFANYIPLNSDDGISYGTQRMGKHRTAESEDASDDEGQDCDCNFGLPHPRTNDDHLPSLVAAWG